MTTVINTPRGDDSSGGVSLIVGILVLLIGVVLFFTYVLPAMRNTTAPKQEDRQIDVNVKLPNNDTQGNTEQPAQ